MDASPFTLRVRLVFHPTGVTIKVASHGREIGAVPLEPRDKPQVLPMRRLRAVYLYKPMNIMTFGKRIKMIIAYDCTPVILTYSCRDMISIAAVFSPSVITALTTFKVSREVRHGTFNSTAARRI